MDLTASDEGARKQRTQAFIVPILDARTPGFHMNEIHGFTHLSDDVFFGHLFLTPFLGEELVSKTRIWVGPQLNPVDSDHHLLETRHKVSIQSEEISRITDNPNIITLYKYINHAILNLNFHQTCGVFLKPTIWGSFHPTSFVKNFCQRFQADEPNAFITGLWCLWVFGAKNRGKGILPPQIMDGWIWF